MITRRGSSSASTPDSATGDVARIALLMVIAASVAVAVWFGTRSDNNPGAGQLADQTAHMPVDAVRSERLAPNSAAAAPASGVVLPSGASMTDGHPKDFPYTDLGAAALQVELARAQIGFDYDQAAGIAEIYADPADQGFFQQRSHDAVALRRQQAGLPAEGDVPAPASYAVTPLAFTLEQLDADFYAVNLLSYVTLTSVDGEARDGLYAGTQLVRWTLAPESHANGGDWKVVAGNTADLTRLLQQGQPAAAAPGTPTFSQAGWIMIDPTSYTPAETGRAS